MKRLSFLIILTTLMAAGIHAQAQVLNQATVQWITLDNPEADPYLCVFGNTIEDVTLIDYYLNLDGKEILLMHQREEIDLHQIIRREAERLNAKYISFHIIQRKWIETDDRKGIETYFIVYIYERIGNKYYVIADNYY